MITDIMLSIIKFAIFAGLFRTGISIKLEDIIEPCTRNFITQDYEEKWDNHVLYTENVTFYMPFASKYDIYVMTQNLFQTRDFKYLTESHLENSCLTVNRIDGWDHANVTGYNARSLPIRFIPTDIPKLFRFYLPYPNGGLAGYASVALTDNESYNLYDYCFDNGLRSFAVVATSRHLDETTLTVIKSHVKSLGFKERNFVSLNYFTCFDTDGNLAANMEDIPRSVEAPKSQNYEKTCFNDNTMYETVFDCKKKK